jgi:hypothetical protein
VKAGRSAATPVNTVFGRFTRTDGDGAVYVHYLRVLRMIADCDGPLPDDVRELHAKIGASIDQQLDQLAEPLIGSNGSGFNRIFNGL